MTNQHATSVIDIQLVLIRGLLDKAENAARAGGDVDLMMAMLIGDVANETAVKTALNDRGLKTDGDMATLRKRMEAEFPGLVGRAEIAAAVRLRQARNPVQHAGMVPARTQVLAHLSDARDFVALLVKEAWKRDFGEISVVSLVHDPELQPVLLQALVHLDEGELMLAAVHIGAAYEAIRIRFRRAARFAGGLTFTEQEERRLPATFSVTALAVFGETRPTAWKEPRLAEDDFGPAAELIVGFSLEEMALLRHLLDVTDAYVSDGHGEQPKEKELTSGEIAALLEIVARQLWRLESEQPTLFGPNCLPMLYSRGAGADERTRPTVERPSE